MDLKTVARARFDAVRPAIVDVSHRIHAHPELGFEEEKASTWLSEMLTDAGFTVGKGICDLPTAFVARAGSGPLHHGRRRSSHRGWCTRHGLDRHRYYY